MHIEHLDEWTPDLDALADSSANATFYHTGTWLRALVTAYPRMSLHALAAVDEGRPVAFLPYLEARRGFLRSLWSLPFGTYGGPVGEAKACAELFREYRRELSGAGVVGVGCVDYNNVLDAADWDVTELATHRVDISGGFDLVWREGFDRRRRRNLRHAENLGVTVRRSAEPGDVARFMDVYRERLNHWKAGRGHPESLFRALIDGGGDRVRLYVAEHEGDMIGGHLNFFYKHEVIAWYGMTSIRASDTQASTLLIAAGMRDASAAGFRTYNVGASLGKRSLVEYKESLGGVSYPYRMLRRQRLGGRVAALMRRAARPA
jgi:hypothetical protein